MLVVLGSMHMHLIMPLLAFLLLHSIHCYTIRLNHYGLIAKLLIGFVPKDCVKILMGPQPTEVLRQGVV